MATILVVEDEEPIRRMVTSVLKKEGYDVMQANDPAEAAENLGDRLFTIDLLLTDIILPRMSGTDFAREILENRPTLRVIFASGSSQITHQQSLDIIPHQSFLQKPYTPEELRQAVRDALS